MKKRVFVFTATLLIQALAYSSVLSTKSHAQTSADSTATQVKLKKECDDLVATKSHELNELIRTQFYAFVNQFVVERIHKIANDPSHPDLSGAKDEFGYVDLGEGETTYIHGKYVPTLVARTYEPQPQRFAAINDWLAKNVKKNVQLDKQYSGEYLEKRYPIQDTQVQMVSIAYQFSREDLNQFNLLYQYKIQWKGSVMGAGDEYRWFDPTSTVQLRQLIKLLVLPDSCAS